MSKEYFSKVENGSERCVLECTADSASALKSMLTREGYEVKKIVLSKGRHICKYCNGIADGDDENLLCFDCMETFGHSLFSDL